MSESSEPIEKGDAKSCPFCTKGKLSLEIVEDQDKSNSYFVMCECGGMGPSCYPEDEEEEVCPTCKAPHEVDGRKIALEKWNTRGGKL